MTIGRADLAYLAEHGIRPMIGTGPCAGDEATVWYNTDIAGPDGRTWDSPPDAIRSSAGKTFTLSAVMRFPKAETTNDCAFITSVGYSLYRMEGGSALRNRRTSSQE